ncbi:MAG: hypothetical protein ACKOET_14280, partial [Verrucomicrobiota bacterium]
LSEAIAATDPAQARQLSETGEDLDRRWAERCRRLAPDLQHPPRPVEWDARGRAILADGWHPDVGEGPWQPGRDSAVLRLEALGESAGSWRQTLLLPPGRYRFSARIGTRAVVGAGDRPVRGAGIVRVGADPPGPRRLAGTRAERTRTLRFEADGPVTLGLELRARAGGAWFPLDSLQLERR